MLDFCATALPIEPDVHVTDFVSNGERGFCHLGIYKEILAVNLKVKKFMKKFSENSGHPHLYRPKSDGVLNFS